MEEDDGDEKISLERKISWGRVRKENISYNWIEVQVSGCRIKYRFSDVEISLCSQ
jgi:hypothetical protein